MSTKAWKEAKTKFTISADDEPQTLIFLEQLIKVADAEIKRLVLLLQEMHRQSAKLHVTAGRIAWDTKEFELEKVECTACEGTGSGVGTDICGVCGGSGEMDKET